MKTNSMDVKIYAPFKVYYAGPADSLTASSETGPFDILPQHKNFMSLLKPGNITVRQKNKPDFNLKIDKGVLHFRKDKATVFLDV